MERYNVELKYQTTVDAENESDAYRSAREELLVNTPQAIFIHSHCRKSKNNWDDINEIFYRIGI